MKKLLFALVMLMGMGVQSLLACAACFGQSDSPLAQGMNWGIACLLAVIVVVLSGVVVFFVHVGKKSAALDRDGAADKPSETEK